jgi:hypothetical protein
MNTKFGENLSYPARCPVKEKEVLFSMTEEGVKLMAMFISQLVREGVTFKTQRDNNDSVYMVELTGGY